MKPRSARKPDLQDTPQSVTVVSRELMQAQAGTRPGAGRTAKLSIHMRF